MTDTPDTTAPAPSEKKSSAVLTEVTKNIDASPPIVREKLIAALTDREVAIRVDKLDKALAKRREMENDLRKIKPDVETFDADGKVTSQSYTKAKAEELKKAREQLAKLESAFDKAIEGDFGKLNEFLK